MLVGARLPKARLCDDMNLVCNVPGRNAGVSYASGRRDVFVFARLESCLIPKEGTRRSCTSRTCAARGCPAHGKV